MSGLRVLLLTTAAFAAICLLGFALLPDWQPAPVGEEPPVRSEAPIPSSPPSAGPTARRASTPSTPSMPDAGPLTTALPASPPPPLIPPDAILHPPRWFTDEVRHRLQRPLESCLADHGSRMQRPVHVAVSFAFDVLKPGRPSGHEASLSSPEPYLQSCIDDLLAELPLPELGGPAAFEFKEEFTFTEGGPPEDGWPEGEEE